MTATPYIAFNPSRDWNIETPGAVIAGGFRLGEDMSIGPYGDMYVVLGHKNEMRADKKWQTVSFRTHYFTPLACNTLREAEDFVEEVKHAYSADIMRLWNPIDRKRLSALADVLSAPEQDADCDECPLRKWCEEARDSGRAITCFECRTWHAADVIREAIGDGD